MKLKRIAAVCIAIVIMFSLTACKSSSSSTTKSTGLSKLKVGQEDVKFGNFTWKVLDIK